MIFGETARRLAALALTIGAVWLCGVSASADSADYDADETPRSMAREALEKDYSGKTVILHSNDVMGAVEGYPRMAWLKQKFERQGAETILVDTGNFSMGAIYSDSTGGAAVELMNLTGYDVATLGRFEFSYGYDAMRRNLRRAAFPILCANAMEDGENLCTPNYTYTTKSGVTVGFFGILTPKAEGNFNLMRAHDIEICQRGDIAQCVQAQIDALRRPGSVIPGADVVIGLSSLDSEEELTAAGYDSLSVFSKAKDLDMILGVSGSVMTAGANGERVQSCGESFAYIGVVVIGNDTKSIESHYLIAAETLESDETVAQAAEVLQNRYKTGYNAIIARTEADLNGEKAPGNRTEETNLGDLIADAMAWKARQELKGSVNDKTPFVGLLNGSSIRAGIPEGYITGNHIAAAYPFADTLSVVYVTGAELLEVLEASTWCLPQEYSNSYPQTSGISFTLDERIPFDAGELYPDSIFYRPASVRRARVDSVRGQPFDPEARYAVATNSYCAGGSGTFHLFGEAKERYDFTTTVEQCIADYIRYGLGGVVPEALYGKPRGEHTILS